MITTPIEQSSSGSAPRGLTDPLACQTSWLPINNGGAGGRTRKLVKAGPHRMEFRPTATALLLPVALLLAGLFVVLAELRSRPADAIGPLILGVITTCAAGIYLHFTTTKAVFDKPTGVFAKTKRTINAAGNLELAPQRAALDQIHALQLLSKTVHIESSSTFQSYELNLVFHNGERMNVADHGSLQWIRQDAATLSLFLEKPVWDGIA